MSKKDNSVNMPGLFGGLVRYNEEYDSIFKFTPTQVMIFVAAIALGVLVLEFLFPIA